MSLSIAPQFFNRPGRGVRGFGVGLLLVVLCSVVLPGCRPKSDTDHADTKATVEFSPNPPVVGVTAVTVTLADPAGAPIRLGHLEVEGNMNHAGMKPVFTRLQENDPGRYAGTIAFSMGGDWFLMLSGQFPDGRRFEKKIDVPGIRSR